MDIESLRKQAEEALKHHKTNIKQLESIDLAHHKAPALELKNTVIVEVIQPLQEMILMLDMFEKMGLENVPQSMFSKWQVRFECILSRMELVE